MIRTGLGYDIHALVENRSLVLGGIVIPHTLGLLGHSDADVLCHAISDALLGAAALGDIGEHFPDTDPAFKGADSLVLLGQVGQIVREAGFAICNIDSTVVAQAPKLSPFKHEMARNIATTLNIEASQVSVKATTNEGFDATGQKQAISAMAVVTLESQKENIQ